MLVSFVVGFKTCSWCERKGFQGCMPTRGRSLSSDEACVNVEVFDVDFLRLLP